MEGVAAIVSLIVVVGLIVGIPLSILRSLDEIKTSQRRIERRLDALEARARGYDAAYPDQPA